MRKFFSVLTLVFVSFAMMSAPAEAKRFGGGKSFGKSFPSFSRSAAPKQKPAAPQGQGANSTRQAAAGGGQRSGASRWLGPLAGLAAGGLLAAMLFGDGFEGFQIMDFLVIAALAFGGMMLFKAMRGGARRPQYAGANSAPTANPFGKGSEGHGGSFGTQAFQGNAQGGGGSDVPSWFDEVGFVEGSKSHFIRLQAAWDAADMKDISEYVTPELLAELTTERQSMGSATQVTEVMTLEAEMLDVQTESDTLVASVRFSGLIREDADAPANDFAEVWHVVHDARSPEGDWLIAGIQQL